MYEMIVLIVLKYLLNFLSCQVCDATQQYQAKWRPECEILSHREKTITLPEVLMKSRWWLRKRLFQTEGKRQHLREELLFLGSWVPPLFFPCFVDGIYFYCLLYVSDNNSSGYNNKGEHPHSYFQNQQEFWRMRGLAVFPTPFSHHLPAWVITGGFRSSERKPCAPYTRFY